METAHLKQNKHENNASLTDLNTNEKAQTHEDSPPKT